MLGVANKEPNRNCSGLSLYKPNVDVNMELKLA